MHPKLLDIASRHDLSVECQAELARLFHTPISVFDEQRSPTVYLEHDADDEETKRFEPPATSDKYVDLGLIGAGGMGEVRLVRDMDLNRVVAMKVIRADRLADPRVFERFVAEAQLTAQLTHPGIVPVHTLGRLPDGRFFFTMRRVDGVELGEVVFEEHRQREFSLHRLMSAFGEVCDIVGFAHARRVIHCDLKPSNIMVEGHGIVQILDWGVARVLGEPAPARIVGTPIWMAPEQAQGRPLTVASDVYALGALLYLVLCGHPPHARADSVQECLDRVIHVSPPSVVSQTDRSLPAELVQLCDAAMARDPVHRPADAQAMAAAVKAWMHGIGRRAQGRAIVERTASHARELERKQARRQCLLAEARRHAQALVDHPALHAKLPIWRLEDEASELQAAGELLEVRIAHDLQGALRIDPDLPEAHRALAAHYHQKHREQEVQGLEAPTWLFLLGAHDRENQYQDYLAGKGRLCLRTQVPAHAQLFRVREIDRRWVPELEASLGTTPVDVELPMGSYMIVLSAPGVAAVRYPVFIERQGSWQGEVHLPSSIPEGAAFVPGGPFWAGGDAEVPCLPRRKLWVDDFFVQHHPVTNRAYLEFLNALPLDEALQFAPRENAGAAEGQGPMIYGHDGERFHLTDDAQGDRWEEDAPVVMVDWYAATAFARWYAALTGEPWRLGSEYEWEKAARGVDARIYPWGSHPDPAWMCIRASHRAHPGPTAVDATPEDVSPYGVFGMAGNVRDWCLDAGEEKGAPVVDGRVLVAAPEGDLANYRGGSWYGVSTYARLAYRAWNRRVLRNYSMGFRLFRSR